MEFSTHKVSGWGKRDEDVYDCKIGRVHIDIEALREIFGDEPVEIFVKVLHRPESVHVEEA